MLGPENMLLAETKASEKTISGYHITCKKYEFFFRELTSFYVNWEKHPVHPPHELKSSYNANQSVPEPRSEGSCWYWQGHAFIVLAHSVVKSCAYETDKYDWVI